jgi:hypothetical protein
MQKIFSSSGYTQTNASMGLSPIEAFAIYFRRVILKMKSGGNLLAFDLNPDIVIQRRGIPHVGNAMSIGYCFGWRIGDR